MTNPFKKIGKNIKKVGRRTKKVVPKKVRKKIVKGTNKFSKEYEKMDKLIYKNLKSVPVVGTAVAETYNLGNSYINPLGTIKNASDVISGRQSVIEGFANEYTPYGDYTVAKGIYDRNK